MRLIIDSEYASSSSVGHGFSPPAARDGMVRLDVPAGRQELENWCWAAIAATLGSYYGTSRVSQSEVASIVLQTDCSDFACDGEARRRANTTTRLDTALRVVGCYSHWSPGKPLFDRVRFEINLGRPLAARIGWHAGAAHYVLVHGYGHEGKKILVADPLHGAGVYAMANFPSAYRQGGAWTETFWTTPSECRSERGPEERTKLETNT